MKKTLLLISLIIIGTGTQAQTNYPLGIPGCIGRWDFTSPGTVTSVPDVSGNNNNGTSNNLTASPGFRGVTNSAMSFNGNSSYAEVPYASMLSPTQVTMVAMVRLDTFYYGICQNSMLITKGHDNQNGHYGLGIGDNAFDHDCLTYSPNHTQLGCLVNNLAHPVSTNYVQLHKWYFLAATYNGNSARYYKVEMDPNNYVSNVAPYYTSPSISNPIGSNAQNIFIGKHPDNQYPYWVDGDMDEIALFNQALPTSDIQTIYDYLWGVVTLVPSATSLCANTNFNVNYTVYNPSYFLAGNTFTVQLSDASGSFASPVNIGTISATTSGTIPCTIPAGTPAGAGYRIRIVSTNIPLTTFDNGTNININNTIPSVTANSNTPVCLGGTINLNATNIPGATYQWVGPIGFTSGLQNPSIINATTNHAGAYTVTVSLNGCTSVTTTVVSVNNTGIPTLNIFPSPNDSICLDAMVTFTAIPNNLGSAPQFQWMKNGNPIPGANAVSYQTSNIATGDYFSCEVINNTSCPIPPVVTSNNVVMTITPAQPAQVTITASPGLNISPWQTVTFTAHPTMGGLTPSYQWLKNGQKIIGAISDNWSANNLWANDTISVVLVSSDPCARPANDTSNILVMNVKTGISSANKQEDKLTVYPNPNTGNFNIRGTSAASSVRLEIVNSIGQTVYNKHASVKNGEIDEQIYLGQQLANGMYILRVTTDKNSENMRFTVDR